MKESDDLHIGGIIAEYNPFHNGHAHLIAQARALGCTHIAAVMSGNFTQRGDVALLPKHLRAAAALECGADLVLELPVCYAAARAQTFALGGVQSLQYLGVHALVFGSECADLAKLTAAARLAYSPALLEAMAPHLNNGAAFAAAREQAAAQLMGDTSVFANPNDTLASEYIAAAGALGADLTFLPVKRVGVAHDAATPTAEFASASAIRAAVQQNDLAAAGPLMPTPAFTILQQAAANGQIADVALLERAMLSKLRTLTETDLAALPDISEGLHHRLYKVIRTAGSLEQLYAAVKSKRYTLARIRRLVFAAYLGLTEADIPPAVPYLRVLACNQKGQEILTRARKVCPVPIALRGTELKTQPLFALECRASDLYGLALPCPMPCGSDFTQPVYKGNLS